MSTFLGQQEHSKMSLNRGNSNKKGTKSNQDQPIQQSEILKRY